MIKREDFSFEIDGVTCIIRNVPVEYYEEDDEGSVDLGAAVKVEMLKELIYAGKIPCDVDFSKVEDLKFGGDE